MLTPAAGLIMDMVLMGLLLAALWFGMRLNARLKTLRGGQEAFIRAVAELDQAAIKAHTSLRELHANADETQDLLHGRILAARDLMGKLESQINRAERLRRELDAEVTPVLTRVEPRPEPRREPEPELEIERAPSRPQAREAWASARDAEARQTYAGRGRPAYEEAVDDEDDDGLSLPLSRRVRDLNDRLSGRERRRIEPKSAPMPEPETDEDVSLLGLEAINEMLKAFADPRQTPPKPEPQPAPQRASSGDDRLLARRRLPSALDAELFEGDAAAASSRPEPGPEPVSPAPDRPLFRRLR
ncbi:MAG: DUF6468 domain-containing protein [Asticcacaulis sp.]